VTTLIVLAMHGVPPSDFPKQELAEYFRYHAAMEAAHHSSPAGNSQTVQSLSGLSAEELARYQTLNGRLRAWPRDESNDPFIQSPLRIANTLKKETGMDVIVGFNQFCAPSLEDAFDEAAQANPRRILVITAMMTAGGLHGEIEIPAAIRAAAENYPEIEFIYAWPFGHRVVAGFLAAQVERYLSGKLEPMGWR
jgi:sirohydrochlorin cobaltochelatase